LHYNATLPQTSKKPMPRNTSRRYVEPATLDAVLNGIAPRLGRWMIDAWLVELMRRKPLVASAGGAGAGR
jgi:hypothetical protein